MQKYLRPVKTCLCLLRCYASAWWGFTPASDRSRLESVLRRGQQSGLCSADVPTIAALVDRADDNLFESILHNPHHVYTEQSYAG